MESSPELLFGRLAIKAGYLTEDQLHSLLYAQGQAAQNGKKVSLGDLCRSAGFLNEEQVRKLLLAQQYTQLREEDQRLGALAVSNGFSSQSEVLLALDEQRKAYVADQQLPPRLGEILIDMGTLTRQRLDALLAAQERLRKGAAPAGKVPAAEPPAHKAAKPTSVPPPVPAPAPASAPASVPVPVPAPAPPPSPAASTPPAAAAGTPSPPAPAPKAPARLVQEAGEGAGRVFPLGALAVIGRHHANEVPIADRESSRQHARVELQPGTGQYVLRDLTSKNGTHLNDQRLRDPRPLVAGDRIRIGEVVLRFEAEPGAAPPAAAATTPAAMAAAGVLDLPYTGETVSFQGPAGAAGRKPGGRSRRSTSLPPPAGRAPRPATPAGKSRGAKPPAPRSEAEIPEVHPISEPSLRPLRVVSPATPGGAAAAQVTAETRAKSAAILASFSPSQREIYRSLKKLDATRPANDRLVLTQRMEWWHKNRPCMLGWLGPAFERGEVSVVGILDPAIEDLLEAVLPAGEHALVIVAGVGVTTLCLTERQVILALPRAEWAALSSRAPARSAGADAGAPGAALGASYASLVGSDRDTGGAAGVERIRPYKEALDLARVSFPYDTLQSVASGFRGHGDDQLPTINLVTTAVPAPIEFPCDLNDGAFAREVVRILQRHVPAEPVVRAAEVSPAVASATAAQPVPGPAPSPAPAPASPPVAPAPRRSARPTSTPRPVTADDAPAAPAAGSSEDVVTLLQRLADLHAAGVLTEEEFQAKKKELLDRL